MSFSSDKVQENLASCQPRNSNVSMLDNTKKKEAFMFMYHPDQKNVLEHHLYGKGWRGKVCETVGEVADLVKNYATSPCMWAHGERLKVNFRAADWIGLDFDKGMSLQQGIETFEPYMHVLGTTKSHQILKDGEVRDRFRVFLKLTERIKRREDFEATATYLIKKYGADEAAKDAARKFVPCKEIIVSKYWGKTVSPINAEEIERKRQEAFKRKREQYKKYYSEDRVIPGWIDRIFQCGPGDISRNDISFRIAKVLMEIGYSEHEIVTLIMDSQIPSSGDHPFTEDECFRTVRSAFS